MAEASRVASSPSAHDERPATLEDLEQLCALDARCFTRPWVRHLWASELASERTEVRLIAGKRGAIVAAACWSVVEDIAELRRIATHPDARRTGLGRRLLAAAIERARACGCVRFDLEVGASNRPAIILYRQLGFVQVGRRAGYYRDPPDDAALFSLELEPL